MKTADRTDLLKVVVVFSLIIPGGFANAWFYSKYWEWFIFPEFNIEVPDIFILAGLSFLLSSLKLNMRPAKTLPLTTFLGQVMLYYITQFIALGAAWTVS